MYLRFTRRNKDGKAHRYWSVVESRRCADGRVVQKPLLYLGEINDSQHAAWCRVIDGFDEEKRRSRQLALFPAGQALRGYRKASRSCTEPVHLPRCPLPSHPLRKGALNQAAYAL